VDLVLLEELINSTEYLIKNLSDQNIDIADITELGKQLTYIKEYTEKQNAGEDNDVLGIKGILSALDYNPENPKFLLKSIKVKDQNILTVSPYIEEKTLVPEVLDSNFDEAYDYPRSAFVRGRIRLPILMYHHIDTTSSTNKFVAGLYVSPLEFEKQVAYLTKKNYKTVNIPEFNTILSSGKNPEQKTVMITFDDGLKSHYTQAYPILKKYGQTGVFFVISNRSYIAHQQLKEMANNGMGIESHSKTHPDLTKVSTEELSAEIVGSKSVLESITGKRVTGIAYPGCVADDRAFPIVQGSRYVAGFSCGRSIDISTSSKFMIPRVHIDNGLDGFIKILSVGGS
jgi:peptidoglycan/xylan/chitin deacetylase (PgdA/CDA1 family)